MTRAVDGGKLGEGRGWGRDREATTAFCPGPMHLVRGSR